MKSFKIKVTPEQNIRVQEELYKINKKYGFTKCPYPSYTEKPYLYFDNYGVLKYGEKNSTFNGATEEEITFDIFIKRIRKEKLDKINKV